MQEKQKNDEKAKTVYDLLWLVLQKYGIALLVVLIVFLAGASFLVHTQAEPGTQVSILGVISYTKAKKAVVPPGTPTDTGLERSKITEGRPETEREYPPTTIRFAYTKLARSAEPIRVAREVVLKRGYTIWPLDLPTKDLFWSSKGYITLVISYWSATEQLTVVAAGPHPRDQEVGKEIAAIYKELTGVSL